MKLEVIASEELKKFGLPAFQTPGAAAIDLRALLNSPLTKLEDLNPLQITTNSPDRKRITSIRLGPGQQITIDSGLRIHIGNPALCGLVLPRSSSGSKGLVLANGTGLIDSDYQGPLLMKLWNRGIGPISIEDGDRVAQYLITNVFQFGMTFVEQFTDTTERGNGGFGSTGSK